MAFKTPYRRGKEKRKYIKNKLGEIISKLDKSEHKLSLPLHRVESYLDEGLRNIFEQHFFSMFKEVQYDELLDMSQYEFDMFDGILTVNSKPYEDTPYPMVDFSELDKFKPLVQHLVWMKAFIELNRLDEELKEGKKIGEGKGLFERILSMDKYDEELINEYANTFQIPLKEMHQRFNLKCRFNLKSQNIQNDLREHISPKEISQSASLNELPIEISSNHSQINKNEHINNSEDVKSELPIQNADIISSEEFIGFMNGKNPLRGNGQILNDSDYLRLVSYTDYLISECKVPLEIIPMPKTNLSNETIVHTYSLIHDRYIKGPKTTKEYIVFIIKVFSQFTNNNIEIGNNYRLTTAYSKFRAPRPYGYKRLINS